MWKEFKEFISNKSIITMATGIIMGSAFTAIVNSSLMISLCQLLYPLQVLQMYLDYP